jgi:ribonucleases P/MRP protein subunit RPP40
METYLRSSKQTVKINGVYSAWHRVFGAIPQGSILGPILFIICINDHVEHNSGSEIYLYLDNAKVFKHILNSSHTVTLQDDVNKLKDWSDKWL